MAPEPNAGFEKVVSECGLRNARSLLNALQGFASDV